MSSSRRIRCSSPSSLILVPAYSPNSTLGELPWIRSFPLSHSSIECRRGRERIRQQKTRSGPGAARRATAVPFSPRPLPRGGVVQPWFTIRTRPRPAGISHVRHSVRRRPGSGHREMVLRPLYLDVRLRRRRIVAARHRIGTRLCSVWAPLLIRRARRLAPRERERNCRMPRARVSRCTWLRLSGTSGLTRPTVEKGVSLLI